MHERHGKTRKGIALGCVVPGWPCGSIPWNQRQWGSERQKAEYPSCRCFVRSALSNPGARRITTGIRTPFKRVRRPVAHRVGGGEPQDQRHGHWALGAGHPPEHQLRPAPKTLVGCAEEVLMASAPRPRRVFQWWLFRWRFCAAGSLGETARAAPSGVASPLWTSVHLDLRPL